jgi:hypothetical protein
MDAISVDGTYVPTSLICSYSTERNQTESPLLCLPAEIRNRIYRFLLQSKLVNTIQLITSYLQFMEPSTSHYLLLNPTVEVTEHFLHVRLSRTQ